VQMLFDPLVVSATVMALARIKQRLPLSYWSVMLDGARAWIRLVFVRMLVMLVVLVPAGLATVLARSGRTAPAAAAGLVGLAIVMVILLVRFAVVDAVVVLEGGTVITGWRRAAALTAGRRGTILGTAAVLFAGIAAVSLAAALAFRAVPEINHFVVRVMLDCALSVAQSLFTIALFLIYWQAPAARPAMSPRSP